MKVVSVSLYGSGAMYLQGAVDNAKLMESIYPGWRMLVFCEDKIPDLIIKQLKELKCVVQTMGRSRGHSGMLWRFASAWNDKHTYTIFRDSDSRLNVREAAAVEAWIESGKSAHCMHDHPHHASLPLFGGMWGIRGGVLKGDCPFRSKFYSKLPRVGDMRILQKYVLPYVYKDLLRHTSVPVKWGGTNRPFPDHPDFDGFVGQQYTAEGNPIWV